MATDAGPFYIAKSTIGGEQAGRGLFSRRDVHGGELIVSLKRPLLASLGIERQKDTCANCYVWTEGAGSGSRLYVQNDVTVQTCAGCKRFRYCSKVGFLCGIKNTERVFKFILEVPKGSMESQS